MLLKSIYVVGLGWSGEVKDIAIIDIVPGLTNSNTILFTFVFETVMHFTFIEVSNMYLSTYHPSP